MLRHHPPGHYVRDRGVGRDAEHVVQAGIERHALRFHIRLAEGGEGEGGDFMADVVEGAGVDGLGDPVSEVMWHGDVAMGEEAFESEEVCVTIGDRAGACTFVGRVGKVWRGELARVMRQ